MDVTKIVDGLYQSSALDSVTLPDLIALGIGVIFDMEGSIDVPFQPGMAVNTLVYHYFPIDDAGYLPDLVKLKAIGSYAADLFDKGVTVLSHCAAGCNRSSLVSAQVLKKGHLKMDADAAVAALRIARPCALSNSVFEQWVRSPDSS